MISYREIRDILNPRLEEVYKLMEKSLASDIELLDKTNRGILANGGKLVRPVLSLLVGGSCGTKTINEDTIRFAATSEIFHNSTLLHDDVADDSTSRRGVPTTMSVLGSRSSVLIGDYWLVKAVDLILGSKNNSQEVIKIFSETLSDLAEGEMLQLQKSLLCDTETEDYYKIIYSKTSSLFVATAHSAAISVGASEEEKEIIIKYATSLGYAFQIKDDILDYTGDNELGKPAGQDLKERKITLPLLGAFTRSSAQEEARIRNKIKTISEDPDAGYEVMDFVLKHDGLQFAEEKLRYWITMATTAINRLPESEYKSYLESLAVFIINRNK